MKTTFYKYVAIVFVAAAMAGCNKLEQLPTNKFTDDVYWKTAARADNVVNMAYNQMYSVGKVWQDESISDNMIELRTTTNSRLVRQGGATPSTGLFHDEWKWIFEGVKTCNVFSDKIHLVPFSLDEFPSEEAFEAWKERRKAEIRFIRAFLYFRATIFWGDVPYFTRDITIQEAKSMTRTSRATIIADLHNELREIIPLLPKKSELSASDRGRITQAAAVMLKARIHLYDNEMSEVKTLCGQIMAGDYGAYSLFTEASANYSAYENLFISANEYNNEVILDYAYAPIEREWSNLAGMAPRSIQGVQVVNNSPTQELVDSYLMINGMTITEAASATGSDRYNEDDPYKNRDKRMDATVVYHDFIWKDVENGQHVTETIKIKPGTDNGSNLYNAENATLSGYYVRKYFDPAHRENLRQSNNIIMMRFADVLLMYAEACFATDDFSETVWNNTIKLIRQRAGFTADKALNYPSVTAAEMKEIIRNERRCELALEGHRYFDLMRWGRNDNGYGYDLLNGIVHGAKFGAGNTKYLEVDTRKFSVGRDDLWPIPAYEIDKAPTLRPNNPGY